MSRSIDNTCRVLQKKFGTAGLMVLTKNGFDDRGILFRFLTGTRDFRFLQRTWTDYGPTRPIVRWVQGSSVPRKSGTGPMLTIRRRLMSMLRIRGAEFPCPFMASCGVGRLTRKQLRVYFLLLLKAELVIPRRRVILAKIIYSELVNSASGLY